MRSVTWQSISCLIWKDWKANLRDIIVELHFSRQESATSPCFLFLIPIVLIASWGWTCRKLAWIKQENHDDIGTSLCILLSSVFFWFKFDSVYFFFHSLFGWIDIVNLLIKGKPTVQLIHYKTKLKCKGWHLSNDTYVHGSDCHKRIQFQSKAWSYVQCNG